MLDHFSGERVDSFHGILRRPSLDRPALIK